MFQTRGINTEQEFNYVITGFKKSILNEVTVETKINQKGNYGQTPQN